MNKEQLKKAFSDAIAWGFIHGLEDETYNFNELRDKKAEQIVEEVISKNKDSS